jgi:hypothetical protein
MQINTLEGQTIYSAFMHYMFICDDPKYSKLKSFRDKIRKVKSISDKLALTHIFETETNSKMDYYNSAY